jgi:hypothetical protein
MPTHAAVAAQPTTERRTGRRASRGQILVIYVMSIIVIVGLMGLVIDVAWYWSNSLRVQRAADAAALAGAVDLPAKPGSIAAHAIGTGIGDAIAEAQKNGYSTLPFGCAGDGSPTSSPGICVHVDAGNVNQLDVMISAPVQTFFMRIFGISSLTAARDAAAVFTLPVPMGSPENYYGVFGPVRGATFTGTTATPADTGLDPATSVPGSAVWTSPTNADGTQNSSYAVSQTTNGSVQQWINFNLSGGALPQVPAGATVKGIEVEVRGLLSASGAANCTLGVDLSWNAGANWSTPQNTAPLTTTNTTLPILGSASSTASWGAHTWTQADLVNAMFRGRLTWNQGGCTGLSAKVDTLRVRVSYSYNVTSMATTTPTNAVPGDGHDLKGPGTACSAESSGAPADCFQPDGATLTARGFWAAMNTKGQPSSQGDAFQSDKDPSGATAPDCSTVTGLRSCYDPTNYYNYAIDMPPGSINGYVYVFDPVFCDTAAASGVGDSPNPGTATTGLVPATPPSSWYELFDTNGTIYTSNDDTLVATSGTKFVDMPYSDTSMGGESPSGFSECRQKDSAYGDARDYHDNWILLNPSDPLTGGADGQVYRLHTTNSTPPGQTDLINQLSVATEQNFALYASASGGTPRIYGLGAMEMFTPLTSTTTATSQFYLAQIPPYYAGKTLELNLWDAGDISPLTGSLSVMMPSTTVGTWTPVNMSYSAGSAAGSCSPPSASGSGVSSVVARNSSGVSLNACWLTLDVVIPSNYTAPQSGWWQIKYAMSGNGTANDVTTWTAHILGNPVHLVVP